MSIEAALADLAALKPGEEICYAKIAKKTWRCALNVVAAAPGDFAIYNYQEHQPTEAHPTAGVGAC